MYRITAARNGNRTTLLKSETRDQLLKKALNQRGLVIKDQELDLQKQVKGQWISLEENVAFFRPSTGEEA